MSRRLVTAIVCAALLAACSASQKQNGNGKTSATDASSGGTTGAPASGLTSAQQKRLDTIVASRGNATCQLAESAQPLRDGALLGPVLDLYFERRRDGQAKACVGLLLGKMGANEKLQQLAAEAKTADRWLAIVAFAESNANARHYAVLEAALGHDDARVRVAAIAAVGGLRVTRTSLRLLALGLDDEHTDVRLAAVAAAVAIDHPEAAMRLHQRKKKETDKRVLGAIDKALKR